MIPRYNIQCTFRVILWCLAPDAHCCHESKHMSALRADLTCTVNPTLLGAAKALRVLSFAKNRECRERFHSKMAGGYVHGVCVCLQCAEFVCMKPKEISAQGRPLRSPRWSALRHRHTIKEYAPSVDDESSANAWYIRKGTSLLFRFVEYTSRHRRFHHRGYVASVSACSMTVSIITYCVVM